MRFACKLVLGSPLTKIGARILGMNGKSRFRELPLCLPCEKLFEAFWTYAIAGVDLPLMSKPQALTWRAPPSNSEKNRRIMEAIQVNEQTSNVPRPRIQNLSDLIFGLALSISALTLIGQQATTIQQIYASLALFVFSFLILMSVWRLYSSITSVLPSETSFLTTLNIILLLLVSIEPYLFNELFAQGSSLFNSVSSIYAFDLAAMFLIIAFFQNSLASEEKQLVSTNLLARYKLERNISLTVGAIFIVSMAPVFEDITILHYTISNIAYNVPLRVVLWIAALLIGWSRILLRRRIKSQH
jgi:uncharacterized membrane protein